MATISVFANSQDRRMLIEALIVRWQCEFILDGTAEPEPTVLVAVHEIEGAIASCKTYARFAVVSPQWQLEPVSRTLTTWKDGSRSHMIHYQYGGPAIDLAVYGCEAERERRHLAPSRISCEVNYLPREAHLSSSPENYLFIKRPERLGAAYSELQRIVRKHGSRTVSANGSRVGPWVMRSAQRDNEEGLELRIGEQTFVPRVQANTSLERTREG
jgi:hypothetical protein